MKLSKLFLLVGGIALVGCGADGPTYPATSQVSGTVIQDGKPVEGAQVNFVPPLQSASGDVYAATGTTGPDGKFTVTTFFSGSDSAEGAVPGNYKVTVTKIPAAEQVSIPDDESAAKMQQKTPQNQLPRKYASVSTTPVSVTVEGGQPIELPITIE